MRNTIKSLCEIKAILKSTEDKGLTEQKKCPYHLHPYQSGLDELVLFLGLDQFLQVEVCVDPHFHLFLLLSLELDL